MALAALSQTYIRRTALPPTRKICTGSAPLCRNWSRAGFLTGSMTRAAIQAAPAAVWCSGSIRNSRPRGCTCTASSPIRPARCATGWTANLTGLSGRQNIRWTFPSHRTASSATKPCSLSRFQTTPSAVNCRPVRSCISSARSPRTRVRTARTIFVPTTAISTS